MNRRINEKHMMWWQVIIWMSHQEWLLHYFSVSLSLLVLIVCRGLSPTHAAMAQEGVGPTFWSTWFWTRWLKVGVVLCPVVTMTAELFIGALHDSSVSFCSLWLFSSTVFQPLWPHRGIQNKWCVCVALFLGVTQCVCGAAAVAERAPGSLIPDQRVNRASGAFSRAVTLWWGGGGFSAPSEDVKGEFSSVPTWLYQPVQAREHEHTEKKWIVFFCLNLRLNQQQGRGHTLGLLRLLVCLSAGLNERHTGREKTRIRGLRDKRWASEPDSELRGRESQQRSKSKILNHILWRIEQTHLCVSWVMMRTVTILVSLSGFVFNDWPWGEACLLSLYFHFDSKSTKSFFSTSQLY